MSGRRLVIGLGIGAMLAAGCKRTPPADTPSPPPTTRVSLATQPASQPTAEALPATFQINGQRFAFPVAKLVTKPIDGGLRVTLFSDDPPEAVRDGYQGNSFYFRFVLDGDSADDIAGQQFAYRTSFAEKDETTSGLFIAGGRQTLRPIDATVTFDRVDTQVIATVIGKFRLYDEQTAGDGPPATVDVRALLEPVAVDASKK